MVAADGMSADPAVNSFIASARDERRLPCECILQKIKRTFATKVYCALTPKHLNRIYFSTKKLRVTNYLEKSIKNLHFHLSKAEARARHLFKNYETVLSPKM